MIAWRRTLYAIWIAQLLAIVGFSLRVPFLPFYLDELGAGSTDSQTIWSGVINAGGAGVMAIAAPIWGVVADRRGRRPMILRAMFGGAITVALMGLVTAPWHLLALRFVEGALTGTVTASTALVAATMPKDRLGFGLGMIQTAVFSGASLGPLVGGLLAAQIGYRATFAVASACLAAGGLVVLFFVREDFTPAPRGPKQSRRAALRASLGFLLGRAVLTMIAVMLVVRLASSATQPIIPLYVEHLERAGAPAGLSASSLSGLVFGALGLTSAVAAVYFGRRGDRVGHRRILVGCAFAAGLLYLPMAVARNAWDLVVLQALFGIAAGGLIPTANALIANATAPERRGTVFGVMAAAAAVGAFIGPLAGSGLAAAFGFRSAFLASALLLLAMAGAVAFSFASDRGR